MATTKITASTTGQYDQIFALSQGYLNQSFQALWANNPDAVTLHKFVQKNIMGSIDAEIGPPEIVLDISPSPTAYVLFNINMLSGKFQLRDSDSGDFITGMPPDGFDLAGYKLSFKVGINGDALDPKDPAHQEIIDRLHADATNYSLSRLYMDLTTADLTNFNGAESKMPQAVVDSNSNWMSFFNTWMNKAHHSNLNTIGYSFTALDASKPPTTINATFLPINNQFQTCEWRSLDQKTAQGIPAGNNNCLLYLQTTKGSDIPTDIHYNYTGNMVDAGETATLFISRKLFWDTWLLPKLTTLNYKTFIVATGAHCSNNEVEPDWGWSWKVGKDAADWANRKDDQDPFYAWKPKSTSLDGPYGFTFAPGNSHWDDHGGILLSKLEADIDCYTENEITFVPGTGTINVKGHVYCRIARWTTAAGSGSAEINSNWSFDIQMTEIAPTNATDPSLVPGGLSTAIANFSIPPQTIDSGGSSWGVQTAPDGAKDDIANSIAGMNVKQISDDIEAGISGLGHFILPGNGTFNMTNPMFNNNGDFLCHLEYLPTETSAKGTT